MFIRYTPDGAEKQEWEFDPKEVKATHAELIESRYNAGRKDPSTWDQYLVALQKGDAKARRVLLWYLLTLTHHTLRFEDTPDFKMGELVVEHSLAELRDYRERIAKSPLDELQKEEALFAIDYQISETMEREEASEGKVPQGTSDPNIGLSSQISST